MAARRAIGAAALLCMALCAAGAEDYQPASPEPTPEETLILEYINRLRADPQAEIERIAPAAGAKRAAYVYGNVDWDMFRKEMEQLKPAPPLVLNLQLLEAARRHSHYMILHGLGHGEDPSKPGYTGKAFGERCKKAGYTGFASGENCFRDARNPWASHVGFTVDFGGGPGGMQPGRGHRMNMMNRGHREIGCSAVPHDERISVTHDFGGRKVPRLAGGVVFMDKNGNGSYDLDEGVGKITISADDGARTLSWSSGAYTLDLKTANSVTLKAEYQGLTFSKTFPAGKENVKFDWLIPQKEAVEKADQLLAKVEALQDPRSPAYFSALVALHLGTDGLGLDPERRKKVDGLVGQVKPELQAHRKAVLDALKSFDPASFPKTLAAHRKPYGATAAGEWFREAEMVGNATAAVGNFERNARTTKIPPSAKKPFIQQLEAGVKGLKEPCFQALLEDLLERAKAVK